VSRVFLEEKTYQVGLYTGVDGKCHFGLDVAELGEPGNQRTHVQFWPYDRKYWKRQKMVAENEKKSKGLIEGREVGQQRVQGQGDMV
jgi:hypothetical protein